nr:unnamed protein product [Callosobruchus analis]
MYVAWGRTVGDSSVPHHARLTLTIGQVDPVYDNHAEHIYQFNYMEYEYFLQVYNAYAISKGFLHGYTYSDVCTLVFDPGSHIWMIREQDRLRIIKQLVGAHPMALSLQWEVGYKVEGQVHMAKGKLEKSLYPFTSGRDNLAKMMSLTKDPTVKPQTMRYMIPKYLKYSNNEIQIVDVLMKEDAQEDATLYRNITTGAHLSEADNRLWWQITETCTDPNYYEFCRRCPTTTAEMPSSCTSSRTNWCRISWVSLWPAGASSLIPCTKPQVQVDPTIPNSYPYRAPLVKFLTPCFHPNVDTSGTICLDILKDKWSALYDVRTILLSIQALLGEPNIDSPLNPLAAEKWQTQDEFRKCVLETYKEA